jgi:ferredoxin-NADP reductase
VDGDLLERHLPDEAFDRFYFVCGPPMMMDAVHQALLEREVPEAHIQLERFSLV